MTILGIDPGIERTGYAVLQKKGRDFVLIECGCIKTSKTARNSLRLLEIKKDLLHLLDKHRPDKVAVESLFFAANSKTAMVVGQARGVVLVTAEEHGVQVAEVTPLQVKIAVTGYGRADKHQVQRMIQKILKLNKIPKPDDAADAAAIAWTGSSNLIK
jgi:crossover junction endodeoxyribonuclease RuvC